MPVKNVECQVAEMQIGRYVSGDILSSEALKQLEVHVASCPSCNRILADRRKALNSMLTHGFAAVSTDIPSANKENLLIKALKEKAEVGTPKKAPRPTAPKASPEPLPKNDFSAKMAALMGGATKSTPTNTNKNLQKPLLYSAALAVVLLAMGYLSRGQGSLLGDSADTAFPAAATVASKPKPKSDVKPVAATQTTADTRTNDAALAKTTDDSSAAKAANKVAAGDPKPTDPVVDRTIPSKTSANSNAVGVDALKVQPAAAQNSGPLDSSSSDNNANEPQLTPSSPRRHRRHRAIAAQERPSRREHKHRAQTPEPAHRHRTHASKAGNKVHVYKPSTIQIYDESGNPLRS